MTPDKMGPVERAMYERHKLVQRRLAAQSMIPVERTQHDRRASWARWMRVDPDEKRAISLTDIERSVCREFRVGKKDLHGHRRQKHLAEARQVYMYLGCKLTNATMAEIGRRINKDHTTVIHGNKRIEDVKRKNLELSTRIEALVSRLT